MMNVCRGCVLGKNVKKSFTASHKRSKVVLDLIHSDVCGPMSSPSINGFIYYVIFIDDFSRKSWIYCMKAKNEMFNKFQEFKALIEKQTGKQIKVLRSDNGGEFESHQFEDFCKEAMESRDNSQFPTIPSRMGSLKERIELSVKLLKL
jgi:transposase InsO family protein